MATARTGNHDQGWNDPPMFGFKASPVRPSSGRTLLNRRVGFEQGPHSNGGALMNAAGGTPCGVQLLPPVSGTATPSPVPLVVPSLVNMPSSPTLTTPPPEITAVIFEDVDQLMNNIGLRSEKNLLKFVCAKLNSVFDTCKACLEERSQEEITRRIQFFKESWSNDRLSDTVKVKITHLVQALHEKNFDAANNYHLSLMVDHIAEVSQWMVGVKKLLHEYKQLSMQPDVAATEQTIDNQVTEPSHEQSLLTVVDGEQNTSSEPVTECNNTTESGLSNVDPAFNMNTKTDSQNSTCENAIRASSDVDEPKDIESNNTTEENIQD